MKIIFLGPQGSGKSTQAKMLADTLNLPYLEMSQLLRDKQNLGDETAALIKQAFDTGHLVPPEIVIKTINEKLNEIKDGYVLDAFPRNLIQLEGFNHKVDKIFYIKVSDDEAVKRLMQRKREDDTPEKIRTRLNVYHNETDPVLGELRKRSSLIEIDGERPIEEIHAEIANIIKNENKLN